MRKLLLTSGLLPLMGLLFFGAMLDMGLKTVLLELIGDSLTGSQKFIATLCVYAMMLLPYILCVVPSLSLLEKFGARKVLQVNAHLSPALLISIGLFVLLDLLLPFIFASLLYFVHSAIYLPSKLVYLKDLVGEKSLAQANAWAQASIALGAVLGIYLMSLSLDTHLGDGAEFADTFKPVMSLVLTALAGQFTVAFWLPKAMELEKSKQTSGHQSFFDKMSDTASHEIMARSIVGLAIVMAIGIVFLISARTEEPIFQVSYVGTVILAGFGFVIGALFAGKVSRDYIELGLAPVGALGVTFSIGLIAFAESVYLHAISIIGIGFSAALFTVPLASLVYYHAINRSLNNAILAISYSGAAFMVIATGLSMALLQLASVSSLMSLLFIGSFCAAVYVMVLMPYSSMRILITAVMGQRYRLKVLGFDNIPSEGGVLMLGNHVSFVDWAILQMSTPRKIRFVIERSYYNRWYLKPILDIVGVIPVSSGNSKQALSDIAAEVNAGSVVCIFPEGALSRHGQLNEFKKGFTRAAKEITDGVIVPFYLHGLWGSSLSRSSDGFKKKRKTFSKRNIAISFGKPLPIDTPRDVVKQRVFDLSFDAWDVHSKAMGTVGSNFIRSCKMHGNEIAITDPVAGDLSYMKMLVSSSLMAHTIKKENRGSANVGIMLPASAGVSIANMGGFLARKTVVNLNFTASPSAFTSAIEQSEITTVYTSKRFIEKLKKKGIEHDFSGANVRFLEDIIKGFKQNKARSLMTMALAYTLPAKVIEWLMLHNVKRTDVAAILFSSGSEGAPKGVCLTHQNFMSNIYQISDLLNSKDDEVMLASLPPFHAFGLTSTTIAPLIDGMRTICCPDPTDAVAVGKLVSKYNATILFGTSTFLRLYARNKKVHPLMFESLRHVITGAEKLSPEVREAFETKFKKQIFEGYGCTETTPVACINVPDHIDKSYWTVHVGQKKGTVGMAVPGTTIRVVNPETMEELSSNEDGLILIGGHQIMAGYLNQPEKTAEAIVELDGIRFYKTGDKGHLDEDGFLTIVDRYSRFAKLGGEMVSLGAVELEVKALLHQTFGENEDMQVVATAVPDDAKGEVVVLLAKIPEDLDLKKLIASSSIQPLMQPKKVIRVEDVPLLGSGKVDLSLAKKIAIQS